MISLLPKWLARRYLLLWLRFKGKEFTYQQAKTVLKDSDELLSVALSHLKKAGNIEIAIDPEDSRRRLYRLKPPDEVLEDTLKELKGVA